MEFNAIMEQDFHYPLGDVARAVVKIGDPDIMETYHERLINATPRRKWAMIWALGKESARMEDFDLIIKIRDEHSDDLDLGSAIDQALMDVYGNMAGWAKFDVDIPPDLVPVPLGRNERVQMAEEMAERAEIAWERLGDIGLLDPG